VGPGPLAGPRHFTTSLTQMTSTTSLNALHADLVTLLGEEGVSVELPARERASTDAATLSPIISELLPLGLADLVAYPRTPEQIAGVICACFRHDVPVTPRGKGSGNYGQGIPMRGGVVLDTRKANRVLDVADGLITAEAGATMVAMEQAANAAGQQLWMYPSTAQSTIGGFLSGGSGGTGSIVHGSNWMGFVTALDVALPGETPTIIHVEGDEAQTFVHTYGTAGVITAATVRLEPLMEWRSLYAVFAEFSTAQAALRRISQLSPAPRLVSADPAPIAAALPGDAAISPEQATLRAILEASTVAAATEQVEALGGQVTDVRDGARHTFKLSSLSYNHPIYWLKRKSSQEWFHVEVGGDALIDRIDEVLGVYPGGLLHIEAAHHFPIGMLTAPYTGAEDVYAGYPKLQALGVRVHSPHQWYVDHDIDELVALKARTDPSGILNPGKVGAPDDLPKSDSLSAVATIGHIMDQVDAEMDELVQELDQVGAESSST
jgi:FAD/FMN-containing dehydrogenase